MSVAKMSKQSSEAPTANAGRRLFSIRWIVVAAAVGSTALSIIALALLSDRSTRNILTRELGTRLMVEARNVAQVSSRALLNEFPELTLQPLLMEMHRRQPQLVFAVVLDQEGGVRGHCESVALGERFAWPAGLRIRETQVHLESGEAVLGNGQMLVVRTPVAIATGESIGTVALGYTNEYINAAVAEARHALLLLLCVLLALSVAASALLITYLLRPVKPLRDGLERIGRGDLKTPVQINDRTEFGLLADTINDMSARIRVAQEEMLEKEHLAREMHLAREIQASLLPDGERRSGGFLIIGSHRAAAEVGGDYYDVFELPGGLMGMVIADVSGKGLAGCMVTSMLAVLLRSFRNGETSPSRLLVNLEEGLVQSIHRGTFVTVFYGILDPASGKLVFASAGHSPTLIYRAATRKVERIDSRAIPVGTIRGGALAQTLSDEVVDLARGDVLIQYTDGFNEAFDETGIEQFGFERMSDCLRSVAPRGGKALIEAMNGAIERWSPASMPHDDETLLVVSRELPEAAQPAAPVNPKPAPAAAPKPVAHTGPLRLVQRARAGGMGVTLPASLDALSAIRQWLDHCPDLADLDEERRSLLEIGLWEVCANIVEHGYRGDQDQKIELWFVPRRPPESLRFVVVDRGTAFRPEPRRRLDLTDAAARRKGRGLGLELIRAAMSRVTFAPATPRGNITVLEFEEPVEEQQRHAG